MDKTQLNEKFQKRYQRLNAEQKSAVDAIDGPVLVVAGPGTGKTELLSLRIANILRETDTEPYSILCLTFTEAAAVNMRSRLKELIGSDAFKVAIHTFHSFGTEIISTNPTFFYQGANYNPADELVQYEIFNEIFKDLALNDVLSAYHPEQGYIYLREVISQINNLKNAGLTAKDFRARITEDQKFLEQFSKDVLPYFSDRINKDLVLKLVADFSQILEKYKENIKEDSLAKKLLETLKEALSEANSEKTITKPLTAWKKDFLKKNAKKENVFKDQARLEKSLSLANVYEKYQQLLEQKGYFDFADMILNVTETLESERELLFNLQERYQYVLVDEFQDTNGVQMKLLNLILSAEVNEGRPNILVVGDEDQAIYKFQGANISNIMGFHDQFRDPQVVVLKNNYRSGTNILETATNLIENSAERIGVEKILNTGKEDNFSEVKSLAFVNEIEEKHWLTKQIKKLIEQGVQPQEIAIIARKNSELKELAAVLNEEKIPVAYKQTKNLLEQKQIKQILTILEYVNSIAKSTEEEKEHLLPEILAFDFFKISRYNIWKVSLHARREKKPWIETLHNIKEFKEVSDFLLALAYQSLQVPVDQLIDYITGVRPLETDGGAYQSNFKNHYFNEKSLELDFLEALNGLYQTIRNHFSDQEMTTEKFLEFIQLHNKHHIKLYYKSSANSFEKSVNLLTAHGCKGLEFEVVFIYNCSDQGWLKNRRRSILALPSNLPLAPEKDNIEDHRRLFYVAVTRAKKQLYLIAKKEANNGRPLDLLTFLTEADLNTIELPPVLNAEEKVDILSATEKSNVILADEKTLLQHTTQNYQLSVTHLNNFLDLVNCGPQKFMEQNLLRFPQKILPQAAYGSAIHNAINQFHLQSKEKGSVVSAKDLQNLFETFLKKQKLAKADFEKYLEKGQQNLEIFYKNRLVNLDLDSMTEFDFRTQNCHLGEAKLTGKIDRLKVDEENKKVSVCDYKTGKHIYDWNSSNSHQQIKIWKYRNQLLFYKLLVESSRSFAGKYQVDRAVLEFVDPQNQENHLLNLDLSGITKEELNEFKKLVEVVYRRITTLDFPETEHYSPDIVGIQHLITDLTQ